MDARWRESRPLEIAVSSCAAGRVRSLFGFGELGVERRTSPLPLAAESFKIRTSFGQVLIYGIAICGVKIESSGDLFRCEHWK
jgi:hypothetical protein